MKLNNFYLSGFLLFLCIYLTLLSNDLLFMIYIYINRDIIFLDPVAFKEAFKATIPLYIPLIILNLIYTQAEKQKKQRWHIKYMQPEKQKKWKSRKIAKGKVNPNL